MYRHEIYLRQAYQQQKEIFYSNYRSSLAISPVDNPYFHPSILLNGHITQTISILHKHRVTAEDHLYLIVAKMLKNQPHYNQLATFKQLYPQIDHNKRIQQVVQFFKKNIVKKVPKSSKQQVAATVRGLILKGQKDGYFSIPDVPVFLISSKWLKMLNEGQTHPGPVFNQYLLQALPYPLAANKFIHYNYQVRHDYRQNQDYKILPYQAWELIYSLYGGTQIRRFTTNSIKPQIQIYYQKICILVMEERALFNIFTIQASLRQPMEQLFARINKLIEVYKMVPQKYLSKQQILFRSKEMKAEEVVAFVQNSEEAQLDTHLIERISPQHVKMFRVQDLGLGLDRCCLILNYGTTFGGSGLYGKIQFYRPAEAQNPIQYRNSDETRSIGLLAQKYRSHRKVYDQIGRAIIQNSSGLQNLGNTCYMNAALQLVLRIQPLSEFFLRNRHLSQLNITNVLSSGGHMACAFGQLVKEYYFGGRKYVRPDLLLQVVAKNQQFKGNNHQDSQQFLNYFLDKLHEDLNRIRNKPNTTDIQSNGRPDDLVSQLSWQNYKSRNDSFVGDLMAGQYRSQIRCPDCTRVSVTFDPFLSLTLQFPRKQTSFKLEGYFINELGQIKKIEVDVPQRLNVLMFLNKYFKSNMLILNQREKKIEYIWDYSLSFKKNQREKGILFFYRKPEQHEVQLRFTFCKIGGKEGENYVRISFVKIVSSHEQLINMALMAIKHPIQKALSKQLSVQQYIKFAKQNGIIHSIRVFEQIYYPIEGSVVCNVFVEVDWSKLPIQAKLNISSGRYQGEQLLRKFGSSINISDLLQSFSQSQQLTQDNSWYCNECKDHKLAQKIMSLYRLPKYLIIHLKRFNHRGNRYVIYGQKVNTPISLRQYEQIGGKKYQLLGVVNHSGSLSYGHYTAYVKKDMWLYFDDSRVYRQQLNGSQAYLLLYQEMN